MKLTLNVLGKPRAEHDGRWPGYSFGGRVRTSTLVLIVAFLAVWWVYDTYRPEPAPKQPAPQVVPPGFLPDPKYTWVPRTRVQPPPGVSYPPTPTPQPTPITTEAPPVTTTSVAPFVPSQLPCLLPPPFCPPSTPVPPPAPPSDTPPSGTPPTPPLSGAAVTSSPPPAS